VSLIELQREIEELKGRLTVREAALAERDAALADRDAKIVKLAGDLAKVQEALKHLLANRRGGGHPIPKGQGALFAEATLNAAVEAVVDAQPAATPPIEEDDAAKPPRDPANRSRRPGKIDLSGLPCEDRLHEVPEAQRVDPVTGQPLPQIGEKVFEELDFVRARLRVIRHRQPIYGLPPEQAEQRQVAPVMAELPPRPLENCAASAMLLAWLLVQKYGNHLPLYRQEEIFGRDGHRLPRQTMCDWALAAAQALQPIADWLMMRIRAGPVMQLDDTPVMCQGGRGESNFQAYLWAFVNPEVEGVAFRFTSGRASDLLAAELGDFTGTLVGDGYSGNRAAADKVAGDIVHAGCWAHVVRKLQDAEKEAPGTARLLRDDIRRLYAIEREADELGLDHEARAAHRQQKARTVLATLFDRTRRLRSQFSDAGDMASALGYIRNQRKPLRRFLADGLVPLDNNACERAIRPIAIGRRNWLFAGSLRGGRAAAVVYTLIESCRLANVDMIAYLADVLVRVATHPANRIEELLPANWATLRAASPLE
jgi:transposase